MAGQPIPLNGDFGVLLDDVRIDELQDSEFQRLAYERWTDAGGLLVVRGRELANLSPAVLVQWGRAFGEIEEEEVAGREASAFSDYPILRIGNVTDEEGNLRASFVKVPSLTSDDDVQYNPETRLPVWHTDSTFRETPPLGSVLHCRIAPPTGGETLFADTAGAYRALDDDTKARLAGLEAVCSLAHHDKKISLYSPGYTILTAEERASNPARYVPVVLTHPVSGLPALYGMNSSTCAIVNEGETVSQELLDQADLEGIEDTSVDLFRDLMPFITGPSFSVRWQWQPGDIVIWDNRCTMHAAAGFDHEHHEREMWRMTLLAPTTA